MKTKLHYVLTISIYLIVFSCFGQDNFFVKVNHSHANKIQSKSFQNNSDALIFEFNYTTLSHKLSELSKTSHSKKTAHSILSFPNSKGVFENYIVTEASVMDPDLQAKYPEIKSYIAYGIDSPEAYFRFSLSPYNGFSGLILSSNEAIIIESINKTQIKITEKTNILVTNEFNCLTKTTSLQKKLQLKLKDADDSLKRIYKLALSVTGEYAAFHGGTLATVNAAINATLTNINAVFEKDLNTSLQLIPNNDTLIYLNAATDPYTNLFNYKRQLANLLDTEISEANYDIGHLIAGINDVNNNPTGDAGCIGCVCNNGGSPNSNNHKGSGFSTGSSPIGFNFDINYVAHEIGHQFGATHTWTHGGNEGTNTQMEPGSGTTIMGYAGITGSTDVEINSDPYFHGISIQQVMNYIKGTSCASIINTGNTTPIVSAGSALTLPIGTAFKLVGEASDPDNDALTYCWEQFNENNASTTYPDPNSTDSNSVLFRSYPPVANNIRYFPKLSDAKYAINITQWEKIPLVNRTADFRLTVRDNRPGGGNNAHDDVQVIFSNAFGPFEVTSQNSPNIIWKAETIETITWAVNNTNSLPGASNVNILLSTDGGETYNAIVNNIPNNGSYNLTVPNTPAPYCRIMVEPTNSNFFSINSENFAINYTKTCTQYNSNSNLGITIADNGKDFTQSSTINISEATTISNLKVGMNIAHTYIEDLEIALLGPDGTQVLLKDSKDCFDEDDIIGVFDDNAVPYNCANSAANIVSKSPRALLSGFNGKNASGNWTLLVGDYGIGDVGVLNSWFIDICDNKERSLTDNELDFDDDFKIFPNPNSGKFSIKKTKTLSNILNVEVFDLLGRSVYNNVFKLNNNTFTEEITLNSAKSGMFLVYIIDGNSSAFKKLVIK